MTSINSSGQLGNVISRLSGLKSVSGRRVLPGTEFIRQLDPLETDVEGTSLPPYARSNSSSASENIPQQDFGGEITPQSYDVRANVGKSNMSSEEPSFFSKLGSALADYVNPQKRESASQQNQELLRKAQSANKSVSQSAPIATEQVDIQESLPPVTASQQESGSKIPESSTGFFGAISDYFSPEKNREMDLYNREANQNAQILSRGENPQEVRGKIDQDLASNVEKAIENPWQYSAYGATNQVSNSPALQAEFRQITGQDFEPQIAQQISDHEEAMKGVEDALSGVNSQLNERSESIKQRILNNQSTDADKYYIGMALLMPLLVGGIFGKEAALGALGGGAAGVSSALQNRQSRVNEDESSLLELNKQQAANQEKLAGINLEKAQLGPALRKLIPKDPNEHLIGMREINWEDPETGREQRGVEIKPGLVAKPQFVSSDKSRDDILKAANELSEVKTYVKEVDDLTEDVANIVSQLKDPNVFSKGFTSIMKDKIPGVLSKITEDVMFDGRMQNAGTLLEEKLGFLANAYGMAKEIGQLDRAAQAHIKKIIDNPTSTLLTPRDALNQVLEVRKLSQRGLIENAINKGFYPEFLIKDLEDRNQNLFGSLNKKENDIRLQQRKRQALKNETNYAK